MLIDQARVDLVNSLTPYAANPWLLNQLGQVYGVPRSAATTTSAFVQFSGPPGFVVAQGFVVSDGAHQYTVTDGGIIRSDGTSPVLAVLAVQPGSWAVPAGTITQLVTSVPSTIALTVTNPQDGIGAAAAEPEENYRVRVLRAGLAASQGMARFLKTLLTNVQGVQARLVSVRQVGAS
ncbi:MAG: baseplate J/gp47 family protein [Acetobacteraceae bacterium]